MKKIFLIIFSIIAWSNIYSQDTVCVYTQKSSYYDKYYPQVYPIGEVDSISISSNRDSVILHHHINGAIKFWMGDLDSVTFINPPPPLDYTTVSGFDLLTDVAYSFLKYWYGKEEGIGAMEMGTDLWTPGSESYIASSGTARENLELLIYSFLDSSNTNIARLWKQFYAGVNACNIGIKIVDEKDFLPSDFQFLRSAELRFLRALYYWHIVETWGGVHLTTDPFYTPHFKANQSPISYFLSSAENSSVSLFYDLIISDLNFAINYLPLTQSEYGRVTNHAARAFLARVYLTRGYITNNAADFASARDFASDVINSGGYSLLSNYESLWDMTKQINSEVIWAVKYDTGSIFTDVYNPTSNPYGYGADILTSNGVPSTNRGKNNLHPLFIPPYDRNTHDSIYDLNPTNKKFAMQRDIRNGWPFNRYRPSKFLMDVFDETRDSRYKGSFQTVWKRNFSPTFLATSIGQRLIEKINYIDTAILATKNAPASANYYTLDVYDTYNPDGTSKFSILANNQLFPTLLKFKDSTRSASPNDYGNGNMQSEKDVFVMRLAEMYLIAAEAEFNLGNIPAAATYINVIRARAEITPGALTSTTSAELTAGGLDFILDEWAREFAGENRRWFDLKRTGKLISRVQALNPDIAPNIKVYHLLRPIPQIQLDKLSDGNLVQNPGY